jgi:hypothetical protein
MTKEATAIEAKKYAESMMLCHPMEREDYEAAYLKGAASMDEYAKLQRLAFDLYKADRGIVSDFNGYHDESHSYSGDELYNQFIEQQNKGD